MKHRLAIVASHVIQYQAPLFRRLAKHPAIDLTVFYCSEAGAATYRDADMNSSVQWDVDLLSGYRSVVLRNISPSSRLHGTGLINPGLPLALAGGNFDAVIFMQGWGAVSYWLGFAACILRGIPFMLYGDSNEVPAADSARSRLRARILRWLFARASAFLVSGKFNADYYRAYGGDESRFFHVPWAIDNDRFAAASALTSEERNELRSRHGVSPDRIAILFSGKLVARKAPFDLLRAFAAMRSRQRAALLFAGDGELRADLEAFVREQHLDNVHFLGFVNQALLPQIYGMSDVFVLPSHFEPRGAVVNEAMAAGLPCVVTDRVGSSGDIVRNGVNGFVYQAGDVKGLTEPLEKLVSDPLLRRTMGDESRSIISRWGFREDVEGIVSACEAVAAGRTRG